MPRPIVVKVRHAGLNCERARRQPVACKQAPEAMTCRQNSGGGDNHTCAGVMVPGDDFDRPRRLCYRDWLSSHNPAAQARSHEDRCSSRSHYDDSSQVHASTVQRRAVAGKAQNRTSTSQNTARSAVRPPLGPSLSAPPAGSTTSSSPATAAPQASQPKPRWPSSSPRADPHHESVTHATPPTGPSARPARLVSTGEIEQFDQPPPAGLAKGCPTNLFAHRTARFCLIATRSSSAEKAAPPDPNGKEHDDGR